MLEDERLDVVSVEGIAAVVATTVQSTLAQEQVNTQHHCSWINYYSKIVIGYWKYYYKTLQITQLLY